MRRNFNKMMTLMGMLAAAGTTSTQGLRDISTAKGKTISFSRYAEDNFGSLSMKRVKGKWRVKK